MYINFNNYRELNLSPQELIFLLAVKNKDLETIKQYFITYKNHPFYSFIKGTAKESEEEKIRLSDKGKSALEMLTEADVTEEDNVVFEWLKKFYLSKGKEIGNAAKTKRHIRDFRLQSGIEKNNLVTLCKVFLKDESNMEYNLKLEYAFYKPETAYEQKFKLEGSRLYQYYLKYKKEFDNVFVKY